jgi:hypothetical protein
MKFPPRDKKIKPERFEAAFKIMRHCMNSSSERGTQNRIRKNIYLFGTASGEDTRLNKVKPTLRRLASFLYSQDSIQFWVELLPDEFNAQCFEWLESVSDHMNDAWHDTVADEKAKLGVEWSCVKGSTIFYAKPDELTDGSYAIGSYLIQPENFGVWREDIPELDKQEAVCHATFKSKPELERMLARHPDRAEILDALETAPTDAGVSSNVFPSSMTPTSDPNVSTVTGIAPEFPGGRATLTPDNPDVLYRIYEVTAWDDSKGDFNVFTFTGQKMIFDRPLEDVSVRAVLPYIKLCADELPDYFWGASGVDDLAPLQDWNSDRLAKLDQLFGLVLQPPMAAIGPLGGLTDEKIGQFRKGRGVLGLGQPGSDVKQFSPQIPDAAFMMLEAVENYFIETAGMRPAMFGKPEPGVRTEGMAASYLRLGGSETRARALVIERQLEQCATLIFLLKRKYETTKIKCTNGDVITLNDFPATARVRVDGHSASPLFIEDHSQTVMSLARLGVIDQRSILDLLPNLPFKSLMKYRLKDRFMANMIAEAQHKKAQQEKRSGKQEAA